MNRLIGKTITAIEITEDRHAIKFITDGGEIVAITDGDCCSSTWIEEVELPALGFPAIVTDVRHLDSTQTEEEYDYIAHYGLAIDTDRGTIVIDYRNASNGYYGGSLCWDPENDYYYGGVYGQNVPTYNWRPLNES